MASNGYPKVTTKAWSALRTRAAAAPTTKFTPSNVAAMLGMSSPDSARDNTVSPMKRLGVIDDDGSLTELGNQWRIDSTYADACDTIIANIYPGDLDALVDGSGKPDGAQVKTWFDHKGFGESNARQMAATYVMIAVKEVPEPIVSNSVPPSKTKKTASRKKSAKQKPVPEPAVQPTVDPAMQPARKNSEGGGPNVHLDIQIHIPADASPDQIDQIFASMAKHLYSK